MRNGLVQGLSIGLFIAEKNRKNPKRIEADLLKILRDLVIDLGYDGIDQIKFQVQLDRR
ncbi:MAG: hypothetical protein ABSD49_07965 [Candidatus Bathyarchaeia archaeon]